MPVVVEGDPIIGVEDDQTIGNAVGCGQETGLAGLQRGLGADPVAHVALGGDEVGQLAGFAEDRRDGCFLVDQASRLVPADDAALPHPTRTGLAVDLGIEFRLVRVAAQDLAWGSTQHLFGRVAGELAEGRIDVEQPVARIGDLDRIADLRHRRRDQRALLPIAMIVGGVGGQEHAAAIRHATFAHPHPAAIDQPMLAIDVAQASIGNSVLQIVVTHLWMIDRPQSDRFAAPLLPAFAQRDSRPHVFGEVIGVVAVEESQPILRVEDRDAVGDALGRRLEPGLTGLEACLVVAPSGERVAHRGEPRSP